MSQDPQGMIDQTEEQLNLLDKAVEQRDVSKIQHHAQELDGMRNLSGPTPMTDPQRQRMRDIATAIDKLDEIEAGPLKSVADGLRALSELGMR
jgi:hypothetical protein